ncbi:hypothetical protein ABPG72_002629, partial [Tetrahymena utriculariae]
EEYNSSHPHEHDEKVRQYHEKTNQAIRDTILEKRAEHDQRLQFINQFAHSSCIEKQNIKECFLNRNLKYSLKQITIYLFIIIIIDQEKKPSCDFSIHD